MVTRIRIALFCAAAAIAQTGSTAMVPRTPDGHPDFQGIWNNSTLTPLERGIAYAFDGKRMLLPPVSNLTISDREARSYEERILTVADFKRGDKSEGDLSGEWDAAFIQFAPSLARIDGAKRTSLIIDPPNGKVPRLGSAEQPEISPAPERVDSVKHRDLAERCLHLVGTPLLPNVVERLFQIVQTPDALMITAELLHETRIIRIGAQHAPSPIVRWMGDSIGRWEGDTLVVDTTNFNPQAKFISASERLHVVERFTPIDGGSFLYRATIEDPSMFSKAWVLEYPFTRSPGPIFEYGCHEGNYALPSILKGN